MFKNNFFFFNAELRNSDIRKRKMSGVIRWELHEFDQKIPWLFQGLLVRMREALPLFPPVLPVRFWLLDFLSACVRGGLGLCIWPFQWWLVACLTVGEVCCLVQILVPKHWHPHYAFYFREWGQFPWTWLSHRGFGGRHHHSILFPRVLQRVLDHLLFSGTFLSLSIFWKGEVVGGWASMKNYWGRLLTS